MTLEVDQADAKRIAKVFREVGREFPQLVKTKGFRTVVKRGIKPQTQARLKTGKRSPDGQTWPAWSPAYAATRGAGHSLLIDEKDLLRRLRVEPSGGDLLFGTPLDYPVFHQEGEGVPMREWLGIGAGDVDPLQNVLDDWAGGEWARRGLA